LLAGEIFNLTKSYSLGFATVGISVIIAFLLMVMIKFQTQVRVKE